MFKITHNSRNIFDTKNVNFKPYDFKYISASDLKLPDYKKDKVLYMKKVESLLVSPLLKEIFRSYKVKDEYDNIVPLNSNVKPLEGYLLYSLIKENNLKNILEVGMATGISSLFMTEALASQKYDDQLLISIDPFQSSKDLENKSASWNNIGITNIKRAGLQSYHQLIEQKSFIAMPELIRRKYVFDLIFIDGMHLMDYTVSDLFYADLLTKPGSFIVLDDIKHKGVKKAYNYILKNYSHWVLIKKAIAYDSTAVFLKVDVDKRPWYYHNEF